MKIKLTSILFLLIGGILYGQNLSDKLVQSKWIDSDHKFSATSIIEEGKSTEDYTLITRDLILVFAKDGTFQYDSLKQKYGGTWKANRNQVVLYFDKNSTTEKMIKTVNATSNAVNIEYEKVPISFPEEVVLTYQNDALVCDGFQFNKTNNFMAGLRSFWAYTAYTNFTGQHAIMMLIGLIFIFLAIRYDYEPLLLVPIGFGILVGNIPFFQIPGFNLKLGLYEPGSVLNFFYQGVIQGWYPPLIFLGIGAMTDFSTLISNPRLMLLGAAAQIGIFVTFIGAVYLGFSPQEAGAIGIIGGADGPTSIFLSSKLAPHLIGPIAIAAYSYMALVPVIQPPVVKLLTGKKERKIKMKPPRPVSTLEKILFPIIGFLLTATFVPSALPLLGMLFFGNLLKESTVTERLAGTARKPLIDTITILLGLTVGASTQADVFLQWSSVKIFLLGAVSFIIATAGGVIGAKLMNLFLRNKLNPMIGAAGVSAVPDSARVVQHMGLKEDPTNHLLMHAMAPNVSGVIGSAVAAGVLLSYLL